MIKSIIVVTTVIVLAGAIWLVRTRKESYVALREEKRVEARQWFAANANTNAFAANRFSSSTEALGYVETLYSLGAKTVYVCGIEDDANWVETQGGPTADSLVVVLPEQADKRAALLLAQHEQAVAEGLVEADSPPDQTTDDELVFWWD